MWKYVEIKEQFDFFSKFHHSATGKMNLKSRIPDNIKQMLYNIFFLIWGMGDVYVIK